MNAPGILDDNIDPASQDVWPHQNGDRSAVPGDRDLLTLFNPGQELGQ